MKKSCGRWWLKSTGASSISTRLRPLRRSDKFEITRKTVQHWIDIVEEESEASYQVDVSPIIRPTARKKKGHSQPIQDESGQTEALKAHIQTLEKELEEAKFKAIYYSTLVQVAGQELGVDLEKKPPWPGPLPHRRTASHSDHADESPQRRTVLIFTFGS